MVALGLGFIAVGSLLLALAGSFLLLVGGRFLQGLGIAAMSAPAASALAELAGAQRQAFAASIVAVALAAGGASAPLFPVSWPRFQVSEFVLGVLRWDGVQGWSA